jgi:P-type Ca2+ transporter type 2C
LKLTPIPFIQGRAVQDFSQFDSGPQAFPEGLSESEAARRLTIDGPNELPRQGHRNVVRIAIDVLREPMFMFLVGAGAVYLLLGERSEALLLSAFATTSVLITVVQEFRSDRVLEALGELTSPRALVIRSGNRLRIAGREVVRDDLIVVSEGDRIPADAVLLSGNELTVDESLLTGESVAVRKIARGPDRLMAVEPRPGGDDTPFVFSGSLAVRGQGTAQVTATGPRSEIGKIGVSLAKIETEPPRLKAETGRLVRLFAIVGGIVCAAAFILQIVTGHGWLQALLAGIALGMAMLPEEFPLVLTVFTVMGAWRISQARVLTRRAAAIEALGEATVLCTDKTGTLTENRMAITELRLPTGERLDVGANKNEAAPLAFHDLVSTGALASQAEPVDPMDVAFVALARRHRVAGAELRDRGTLEKSHGLTSKLLAVTNVWRGEREGADLTVAAKGAPEAIAALCRLTEDQRVQLNLSAEEMAREGLRVLAVASTTQPPGELPKTPHGFEFELLGLVGLADPLRASAADAVKQCQSAGIRVVMITGDYPATALAIARAAGIKSENAVSGDEIEKLDANALQQKVRHSSVFARITPSEKLRIIEALKANGEIVAMTGDGVNDAPSLKAAHIGIAMGGRGTDVAREAAALVLLDDDFGAIPSAIQLGRRIFDNLRKAMGFILAIHIPIAGLALFPLIYGLPPILEPVHIAFLELIIDPVCSIAFESEPEDDNIMNRPPRAVSVPLLSFGTFAWCVAQGVAALIVTGALFLGSIKYGLPANQARALVFGTLIASTIALVLINRTFEASVIAAFSRPNPTLWIMLGLASLLFAITLRWEPARKLFDFGDFHGHDILISAGIGLALLLALETMKFAYLRLQRVLPIQAA